MAKAHQKAQSTLDAPAPSAEQAGQSPGASNASRQDQLRDATGFKGDLPAFTRRMETAFGGSISGLRFVGGTEGAQGVDSRGVATIQGDTVFLGSAFAELAEGDQNTSSRTRSPTGTRAA